jgi:DNA modification methylase
VEDATLVNIAAPDYLIPFRKKGDNPVPVTHPVGLLDYAGENAPPADVQRFRGWTGNQIENRYSHWIWRQYASSVWMDVRIDLVLPFKTARDEQDEKHVHPLQLDVIERCVTLFSNPEEVVLTPFMGVGSEVCGALALGRRGLGIELKRSYYQQAARNVEATVSQWRDSSRDAQDRLL